MDDAHRSASVARTAPPTSPPPTRLVSRSRASGMVLVLILAAVLGLLITSFWWWILWINRVTFSPVKAAWFLGDATMRTGLWALLGVGAALQWRRPRFGRLVLLLWSLFYVIWLPISAAAAVRWMEPPPEYVIAILMSAMVTRMAFPSLALIVFVVVCLWLLGPVVVLTWLWRSRRASTKPPVNA